MEGITDIVGFNTTELFDNTSVSVEQMAMALEFFKILQEMEWLHNFTSKFNLIVICVLLAFGISGNLLVIYVSISTQRILNHPVHSMLVVNLTIADLIYLLCSAPYQAIIFSLSSWIYSDVMCPILYFISCQMMAVSIFTMCSLAVMRFAALMMPFQVHTSFITNSAKLTGSLIIGSVWILATCMAVPNVVFYRVGQDIPEGFRNKSPDEFNACMWKDSSSKNKFMIAEMIFTFVIPFFLVAFLYFIIGRELLCFMNTKTESTKSKERSDYWKATKMVCVLVIAFVVCWLPHNLFVFITVLKKYRGLQYTKFRLILEMMGNCCSYAHACINPIIYTFGVQGFRQSVYSSLRLNRFRELALSLCCMCRKCFSFSPQKSKSESISVEMNTYSSGESTKLYCSSVLRQNSRNSNKTIFLEDDQIPPNELLIAPNDISDKV